MSWWAEFCAWLGMVTGITDTSGVWYGFWSGIGSDIGELTLIGAAFAAYKHHTCHVHGCWRIGRHRHLQDGVEYVLCRKHHPSVPKRVTAEMMTRRQRHVGSATTEGIDATAAPKRAGQGRPKQWSGTDAASSSQESAHK